MKTYFIKHNPCLPIDPKALISFSAWTP